MIDVNKLLEARKPIICSKIERMEANILKKFEDKPHYATVVNVEELLRPIKELKEQFGCE